MPAPAKRRVSPKARAVAEGYRSGLEDANADHLKRLGEPVSYEEITLGYTRPSRPSKYTPDFPLSNGIIVETKGRFVTADRQKHLHLKAQHPDLDVRFVFSNPNTKIGKKSATSYADWCDRNGFLYAARLIPEEWVREPVSQRRLAAIAAAIHIPKGKK